MVRGNSVGLTNSCTYLFPVGVSVGNTVASSLPFGGWSRIAALCLALLAVVLHGGTGECVLPERKQNKTRFQFRESDSGLLWSKVFSLFLS